MGAFVQGGRIPGCINCPQAVPVFSGCISYITLDTYPGLFTLDHNIRSTIPRSIVPWLRVTPGRLTPGWNNMVIGNALFSKRNEHLITYRSGEQASQIDFFLYRRRNIKEIKNCKFKDRVLRDIDLEIEDVNEWWNRVSANIIGTGIEVLGETSGKIWENREAWWFNEEVQKKVKAKKIAKKRWEETKLDHDRENYKEYCKEAKRAVAIAKAKAYDRLYEELDTKEGQEKVFKLAKQRNKSTKDIRHIRQMKDERGIVLRKEREILMRWKDCFEKLLNEENERFLREDGEPNNQEVAEVTRQEVIIALKKMKNGKSTGPDSIPVEVWKALDGDGVDILHQLMNEIMEKEVIPEK
ncbi:uncharacterized protein LOC134766592 [Penaeus indicus]|uniref:uncharacterized protein LOC134766592 n=1 Tax=Penaeus indicus TaxID=29960 RepID=UPI00300BFB03